MYQRVLPTCIDNEVTKNDYSPADFFFTLLLFIQFNSHIDSPTNCVVCYPGPTLKSSSTNFSMRRPTISKIKIHLIY